MGGVAVAAIDPAGGDDPQGRAERLHRPDLHRRGVGAQHAGLLARGAWFQVESIVHRPRRMGFGHVERREIMPLVLDLGPFGDGEAEVGEDFRQFVHHLADGVDAALRPVVDGQRQVDPLGRQPPLELGGLQRRLALGDGIGDRLAPGVDFRAFDGARRRIHGAQRLEQRGDAAGLAERGDAQRLQRLQIGRARDLLDEVVGHGRAALAMPRCKMQRFAQ